MNRLVKRKKRERYMGMHEAVAYVMKAKGCSKEEAQEEIRQALMAGKLRAYLYTGPTRGTA
jgi:hypothetical protein